MSLVICDLIFVPGRVRNVVSVEILISLKCQLPFDAIEQCTSPLKFGRFLLAFPLRFNSHVLSSGIMILVYIYI